MTIISLDESRAATPLRDLITNATDDMIEVRNSAGQTVARLFVSQEGTAEDYREYIASCEADIERLKQVSQSPRETWVSTAELLRRVRALAPD